MPFKSKEAKRESERRYRARNAEKLREKQSDWNAVQYAKNKEAVVARQAAQYAENPELYRHRAREQRVRHKAVIAARAAAKAKANPAYCAAVAAARRAARSRATPAWADRAIMQDEYEAAQFMTEWTGEVWHVDHIVPLRSKLVCGLHCPANLQLLRGSENLRKSNVRWPDMPGIA